MRTRNHDLLLKNMKINKIYNEDCITYMKTLQNDSIDLIIADPPYFKIVKNEWDNQWETDEEYYVFCNEWIKESYRVLRENGALYIWNCFNHICELGHIASNVGFVIRNLITWNRGGGKERNNWCCAKEDLLYLVKGDAPTFNLKDVLIGLDDPNRKMKKSSWERLKYEIKGRKNFENNNVNPSNVWFDSYVSYNSKEKVNFPTQKPLSTCDRIIKASSNERDLVYIPFAGSGSEIVSCIKNNRNYIATEINREYIDEIILPRINNL